jgi:transcriptional regulator GlxA family with amidase domain
MTASHIRIGVFIPTGAQFLDTATVDVLSVMSKEYLGQLPGIPAHVGAAAPNVTISYITSPRQGPEIPLTANLTIKATCSHEDPSVAPGKLDIVIVPGPDPSATYEDGELKWLRAQYETPGVDILSVCTGIYICAAAGIMDGKQASGPRGLQDDILKKYPKVKLVGDQYRWVRDGNIWSSGMFYTCDLVAELLTD